MTQYLYLCRMSKLCMRLCMAFSVTKTDLHILTIYSAAYSGYKRRKRSLPFIEALKPITKDQKESFLHLREKVVQEEAEAEKFDSFLDAFKEEI